VLQGVRGSLLQLHTLRLAIAAKSAIADFRFQDKLEKVATKAPQYDLPACSGISTETYPGEIRFAPH